MAIPSSITIRRPDDWHVHLRDGPMLQACAVHTARQFARAIIMPNLVPPVTRVTEAASYRERIRRAVPAGLKFEPLMTCYLTDGADPAELLRGKQEGVWVAAKLYPAHATTNSALGVTSMDRITRGLEAMEKAGMPLLVHGEVTDAEVDIFDREAVFLDKVLAPLLKRHQGLKIVLEHITTKEGVAFVEASGPRVGGTPSSRAASVRTSIACRSPRARSTAWRCVARQLLAKRNSSSAPTPRRTRPTPRNAPVAAPVFSTRRWRCRSMPRSSPRRARSTGWRPSPR
jgi:dihydroorotase